MYKYNFYQNRSAEDKALTILAYRAIKFLNAYLLVARAGFWEPSAALIRSIYETYLWSRWVMIGNGQFYLETGKIQAQLVAKKLKKHGEWRYNDDIFSDKLKNLPPWSEIAKQTDMESFHDTFYPSYSNYSHGNLYGSVDYINQHFTFESDFSYMMDETTKVSHGLAQLLLTLYEEWWAKGTIAPPPP